MTGDGRLSSDASDVGHSTPAHSTPAHSTSAPAVILSNDQFLWFIDHALDEMVAICRTLGDDRACRRPDLSDANSAYAIVTHCLGVMEYWGGAVVAGRTIARDRPAEFRATGNVDDLVTRVDAARRQLVADLATAESLAPPRDPPQHAVPEELWRTTQGGVIMHIYEELSQHLGQLELTRDVVLASSAQTSD